MRRVLLLALLTQAISIAFSQPGGNQPASGAVSHGFRNGTAGLPGALADLRDYENVRVASVDRPGNADFLRVGAHETTTIAELQGPGEITHLWTTINSPDPYHLRNIVLRIYWDGNDFPSVEAPIGDFYGLGHAKYYYFNNPVQAMGTERGMNAFWPMPFRKSARVEITNESDTPISNFYFYVDGRKFDSMPERAGYFHAQYRQEHPAVSGRNYLLCETGGGKGHFAGVSLSIHTQVDGWWGEGDDIFTIDGETTASLWGTGSEDYFCGAWGYGKEFFTDYFGMPLRTKLDQSPDNYWNVYRLHLENPVTFKKSIKVEIEHGDNGVSNRRGGKNNNYSSVAYFYVATPQRLSEKLPPAAERIPSFSMPTAGPGIFEAQYMARALSTTGALEGQGLSPSRPGGRGWLHDDHLFRHGNEAGDVTELTFETTTPLRGESVLLLTRAPDYGILRLQLDGRVLREKFDAYSAQVEPALLKLGELELAPGRHVLRIEVVGKNDKSTKHYWGIDYLRIGNQPSAVEDGMEPVE